MAHGQETSPAESTPTTATLPAAAQRVAVVALVGGLVTVGLKFLIFAFTNSAAVLGDALESVVNVAAAGMAVISTWYASRPADREHPYGHGKVEFVAVGVEGALVAAASVLIVIEAVRRLVVGAEVARLELGIPLLAGVTVMVAALGWYILRMGRKLSSPTLVADGKHLLADVFTSAGVLVGLLLVRATDRFWLDPVVAMAVAVVIFVTGWRLVLESWHGLMDRSDPETDAAIREVLDAQVRAGRILGYHKLRHRQTGSVHWVDMHLQVPGEMNVREAHDAASEIEHLIEQRLGRANATAHIEPPEGYRADR